MSEADIESVPVVRKHPLAKCEDCPLAVKGKYVASSFPTKHTTNGNYGKRLAFVGESPGKQEVWKGRVFIGPSGKVLDAVIRNHGLSRPESLMTNAIACHYPETLFDKPPKEAVEACRSRLLSELEQADVDTVVTVGAVAATALIDSKVGITKLRGGGPRAASYSRPDGQPLTVVPTFHPAAALRDQSKFPYIVQDIAKLKPGGVWETWKNPSHIVVDSVPLATKWINYFIDSKYKGPIEVDTESGAEKDESFGGGINEVLCIGMWFEFSQQVIVFTPLSLDKFNRRLLGELLTRRGIVAQNGKYDVVHCLNDYLSVDEDTLLDIPVVFDTMLAHYCLVPETRILKTDLTWSRIDKLAEGDELIGFDEHDISYQRPSKVLGIKRQMADCYKITTEDATVVCSANHMWPVSRNGAGTLEWRSTRFLARERRYGSKHTIPFLTAPWEVDSSYEGGYIAGILDGEGCLSNIGGTGKSNMNCYSLTFAQKPGLVASKAVEYLAAKGFDIRVAKGSSSANVYSFNGGVGEHLAALGMFRPVRFMGRTDELWIGRRKRKRSKILSIEYIGNREVIGIETETRTLIAEGLLTHNCLDEGKGVHGLKYMMTEYLAAPDYERWLDDSMEEGRRRKKAEWKAAKKSLRGMFTGKDFSLVDPDVLYLYNAFDVFGTRLLRTKFESELVSSEVSGLFQWLMNVNRMLCRVETNGLAVDLDFNVELELRYKDMLAGIEFKGAEDINPNSWQQVKKYLETMGIRVASTDKTTLKALVEQYEVLGRDDIVDFCQSLLNHRGASKLMGTYITGLRKNLINGVAHPSFLLHGTTTGRLSCRNPNLQNIPRESDMRRQFVPSRTGRVFVQADYAQAELRVLTWLGRDELMRNVFNDGTVDVFVLLCERMYGDRFKNGSKAARKEMRTMIKTMAYGISYGREAKAIAIAFGISLASAKNQMKMFQDMIPGIMRFQQTVKDKVMAGDDLVNPFGRRRRFHLITDANVVTVMNEAMAYQPQATASDICLESAVQLDRDGLEIRNLVHDSILAECERSEVPEVAKMLSSTMIATAQNVTEGYVNFGVDIEVGTRWGDLEEFAPLSVGSVEYELTVDVTATKTLSEREDPDEPDYP